MADKNGRELWREMCVLWVILAAIFIAIDSIRFHVDEIFFESIAKSFISIIKYIGVKYFSYKLTDATILPNCADTLLRFVIGRTATRLLTDGALFSRTAGSIVVAVIETVCNEGNARVGQSAVGPYSR